MPIGFFPRANPESRVAAGGPGRRKRRKDERRPPFVRKRPPRQRPFDIDYDIRVRRQEIEIPSTPTPKPTLPPARYEPFELPPIAVVPFDQLLAARLKPIQIERGDPLTLLRELEARPLKPKTIIVEIENGIPLLPERIEDSFLEDQDVGEGPSDLQEEAQMAPEEIITAQEVPSRNNDLNVLLLAALMEGEDELAAFAANQY